MLKTFKNIAIKGTMIVGVVGIYAIGAPFIVANNILKDVKEIIKG